MSTDLRRKLSDKLLLESNDRQPLPASLTDYINGIASHQGALAVLSHMSLHQNYVWYGAFASTLGISGTDGVAMPTIFEEEILQLIHPDDLTDKFINELAFLHHLQSSPVSRRKLWHFESHIRMRRTDGSFIDTKHLIYYFYNGNNDIEMALCLFMPLVGTLPSKAIAVNNSTGIFTPLNTPANPLLSPRETEILNMIQLGMSTATIAATLHLSAYTVSRHRQNIIARLQVRNTTEAVRIAHRAGLI